MKISESTYNILTPLNMVHILTDHLEVFLKEFKKVLENVQVTSVRIRSSDLTDTQLSAVVGCIQKINKYQIPILIENNLELAKKLQVDGVHLTSGQKLVKEARETLGIDKIIGSFCGTSKHSGLVAAEHGANYVAFQTANSTALGKKSSFELFEWWAEFIEIPVMAELTSCPQIPRVLWAHCDFLSLGINRWKPGDTYTSLIKRKE